MRARTKVLGLMLLGLTVCWLTVSQAQGDPPTTAPGELERLAQDGRTIAFDQGKLKAARVKLDGLGREVDAVGDKYEQKSKDVAQLKNKFDQEQKALQPLEKRLEQDRTQLSADLKGIDERKVRFKADETAWDAAVKQQNAKGEEIARDRTQIRSEAQRLAFNRKVDSFNAEQAKLRERDKQLAQERAQLTKDNAEYNRRVDDYNTRLAERKVRVRVLDSIVYNHDTGVGEVARFYRDYEFKLNQYNVDRLKVNAEAAAVNAQIDAYNKRLDAVNAAQGTAAKADYHPRVVFIDTPKVMKSGNSTKPTHKSP